MKKASFNKFHEFCQIISCFLMKMYVKILNPKIEGAENLPGLNDPCIFVSNHSSYTDIPIVGTMSGPYIAFIAKKELFEMPFFNLFLPATGTIKVDRGKLESSTIKRAKEALLRHGWRVAIFIEGTRSTVDGQLSEPNNGAVYISRLSKVPIIPIGINYNNGGRISVKIGEPYNIDPKRDLDDQSWECLEKISKLSGMRMPPRDSNEEN